ncbi:MAG: dehydrogenase [Planctomycetaceae bacterium]|jgi:2-oxoisovalerate dehydrogenase E1 component|nr:dehydrogenase [Planctomycetaceae bacterium]MDP7277133.1 dehydrogenase E1 component subunit alpha/beta [Planctomycetaceae bacterium]
MTTAVTTLPEKDTLLDLYRTMQVIRQCEEELARCHQRGLVHGACHTYVGEEAIATGVCSHLDRTDVVFSTHRGHGHALAKGLEPRQLIAELFGKETGCSGGRGGSMHLFSPEIGLMGTSGIVASCILQSTGGGYTIKLAGDERVSICFFGDGAVNNGAFHEGLNMAKIWNLPVIFVCENNGFATEVPFGESSAIPDVGRRAQNYGMPGLELDGNDVLDIHEKAGEAIARARSGEGPTLIECKTYRTRTHAEGMSDFTYRTREEVEEWKKKCPILRLKNQILEQGLVETHELDTIDDEVSQLIDESRQFAEDSPWPDPASATTHVYSASSEEPAPVAEPDPGTRELNFVQATHEALSEEMAKNPRIFVMGEGIGARGGNFNTTSGLFDIYGGARLCDTPICERGFVGLGCGAAMTGSRPVIDFMFADFVNDAFGELVNQIAKMQYMSSGRLTMPILLRGCIGIGHSAATHHSGNYYPLYAHFPGFRVVVPSNAYDAKGLFRKALTCDDPVIFLEHRELLTAKTAVPEQEYEIEFGRAAVVRTGTDVTVVAIARMVHHVLEVIDELAADGISVELIDPRTVLPLDTETIRASVARTGRLLVVDETFPVAGIASQIAAVQADLGFDDLDAPIKRLHGAFTPTPYSPALESAVVPTPEMVANAVRELVAE